MYSKTVTHDYWMHLFTEQYSQKKWPNMRVNRNSQQYTIYANNALSPKYSAKELLSTSTQDSVF